MFNVKALLQSREWMTKFGVFKVLALTTKQVHLRTSINLVLSSFLLVLDMPIGLIGTRFLLPNLNLLSDGYKRLTLTRPR